MPAFSITDIAETSSCSIEIKQNCWCFFEKKLLMWNSTFFSHLSALTEQPAVSLRWQPPQQGFVETNVAGFLWRAKSTLRWLGFHFIISDHDGQCCGRAGQHLANVQGALNHNASSIFFFEIKHLPFDSPVYIYWRDTPDFHPFLLQSSHNLYNADNHKLKALGPSTVADVDSFPDEAWDQPAAELHHCFTLGTPD